VYSDGSWKHGRQGVDEPFHASSGTSTGNSRAQLSIALFCCRLARALLGLTAALSSIDALIFTRGIGENNASIRAQVLTHFAILNPVIDSKLNEEMESRATDGSAWNQAFYAWSFPQTKSS
jgi:acetate kinase